MKLEASIKKLNDGVKVLVDNHSQFVETMDKRLGGFDTRLANLEKAHLRKLTSQYGPGEPVPKNSWSWSRYCYGMATKQLKEVA